MVVATNVRPGRTYRTLLATQSAKGTLVTDFTNATQGWLSDATVDVVNEQVDPTWWMSYHNGDFNDARYAINTVHEGALGGHASYASLLALLQSLFGTFAAPNFTLTGYVNQWLTIAAVEDKTLTNTNLRVVRSGDALVTKLALRVNSDGVVTINATYAAETSDTRRLNALAGLVLPPAPMDNVDHAVFPGRTATLTNDGARLPFETLDVVLDLNVEYYWDQMSRRERVIRRGPLTASITPAGKVGDEYWQEFQDSHSNVKSTYVLALTEPISGHACTMTFYGVTFNVEPFGKHNSMFDVVPMHGRATQNAAGNFVSISLT